MQGVSLDEAMLTGIKLQRDVLQVLLRFRIGRVALVADIKKIFSQVVLAEKDRKYRRLLWRYLDPAKPIDVYEAVRLTFGDRASPYLAQFVIRSHALDFKEDHPAAAIVLLRDMYKDGILHSEETVKDAVLIREDLIKVLGDAGFHAQKWCSNRTEVLEGIPQEDQATGIKLDESELPGIKTLGVHWNVKIPRCYRHHEEAVENVSLHTFFDASRLAYAAVSYVRYRHVNGQISVALVTAKARVTPIKLVSVPRLELIAAVLGVRLAETVSEKLEIPIIQHTLWTDSMDVIYWIQGNSRLLKSFVANRVAEIQRKSDPAVWPHVPGDQNPADDATRALNASSILSGLDRDKYLGVLVSYLSPVLMDLNRSVFLRCWHAKTDGWAAATFHNNCDGKGPTVTIIQVNSHIFGGYTNVSWNAALASRSKTVVGNRVKAAKIT
ncbi:hypothetical protein AWC38_SpisGene20999 [Stylophora pistillata]|uniref:TLDc domain-containing protein n=1 Tax=Stylophora pistillata TaxID=50429 RepID=A0A2B4RCE1_STYPI|nr:hypothetical protein AWC38_SpisGene20999 [Stylophora pistillata]